MKIFRVTTRVLFWTYMRENGVDSPYFLFLHPGFSIVASLAHPEVVPCVPDSLAVRRESGTRETNPEGENAD